MDNLNKNYWRKCGACKKEINLATKYYQCSISSCKKFAYCSVDCCGQHQTVMNHKNSWAEENISPSSNDTGPSRRLITSKKSINSANTEDILIVASKLKKYIKDKHDINTAANVMPKLSTLVRHLCDEAISNARQEGRKTLMDRDF